MEVFFAVIGIFAAAAGGFYFGRHLSSDAKEKQRLEAELIQKSEELDSFRNKVNTHFEKTADLFNQVSDSYQMLYDHMAKSSAQLCASPSFRSLPNAGANYAQTSNELKTDLEFEKVFDANNLYNAYTYRNQENPSHLADETDNENQADEPSNIVDIESAKDDKGQPALDYAIKAKGVINHNSLDNDNIKIS